MTVVPGGGQRVAADEEGSFNDGSRTSAQGASDLLAGVRASRQSAQL
jgi:hypothetical protein